MKLNKPKQILSLDGSLAKHKFAVVFFMPGPIENWYFVYIKCISSYLLQKWRINKEHNCVYHLCFAAIFFKHTKCSNVFIIMKALRVEDKKCVI